MKNMKKLLCIIDNTSQLIQIQKALDQNHINYSIEPVKANFFSDLVHMIFYRTVVPGIDHKSESGVYVEKESYETAKKIVQGIT